MIGTRGDAQVILVDNNEDAIDRSAFLTGFRNPICYKPGVNRGVSGGRNDGIAKADADYLIFLDDDAFISPPDFLDQIARLFQEEPLTGILAFQSTNFYTRSIDRAEFPHTDKKRDPEQPFKTFRYIGVGHAIRSEVFERVGRYEDDFFYAMEEFDMSYRAIKAGYEIRYSPEIRVLHKKHASGRLPAPRTVEQTWLNKMRVNFMHLPAPYFVASATLWTFYALWWSRGRVDLVSGFRRYRKWTHANPNKRQPIHGAALAYFHGCGAQLWK
jgi:GT2 family glycosyltransferase